MLNMLRSSTSNNSGSSSKNNFESASSTFDSRFILRQQESTRRLIKKFNLDKLNWRADVHPPPPSSSFYHNSSSSSKMEQMKMLNYPVLPSKSSKLGEATAPPPPPLTSTHRETNSASTSASTLIKSLKDSEETGNFNVYYNTADIKYPYAIAASQGFLPQRPKTASRHNADPPPPPLSQSNDFLQSNDPAAAHLLSYSNFDFNTPLTNRKKEEAEINAVSQSPSKATRAQHADAAKIVTISQRLSGFRIQQHNNSNAGLGSYNYLFSTRATFFFLKEMTYKGIRKRFLPYTLDQNCGSIHREQLIWISI